MATSTSIRTLRIFVSYWLKRPVLLMGTLLLGPAYALQSIISPLFIAKIVNQLVAHEPVSMSYLWYAGLSLLAGILLTYLVNYKFEVELNIGGIKDMYNACLKHLLRQEYGFFADNFAGSLVTRANRMAKGFELFTYTVFLEMLGLLVGVIIAFVIMIWYSPVIGLMTIAVWLLSIALVVYMAIKRMPIRRAAVAKETEQTGELADIVTNAITVKTFARESSEQARYEHINETRSNLYTRSWKLASHNGVVTMMLCAVLQFIVLGGGIWSVQSGTIAVGTFLLFQVYILRILDSIGRAGLVVRQFEGILGDTHEMTELLAREPIILDKPSPQPMHVRDGLIAFNDVTFSYTQSRSANSQLLEHFDLRIEPGEKVGLVGPSGGGKTTLTKLLLRFVDVQQGGITIDGQDIRDVKQDDLHTAISYVPQEPLLFHRSIRENIAYGQPGLKDTDIVRIAKQAHAHEFIKGLPHGYDTLVGERGIKLSGGQRQRIAIARAMAKKAPILVLDEATSALDSESEAFIQQGLWNLMQGKTTIVIAHRLSTIQKMDRIVVLDKGKIVEEGTHKQLIAQGGLYGTLWAHQSGGFIDD
jgi:ATP-binding cassette subfamily B protein